MSLERKITEKLASAFGPSHLEVVNESGSHNVPKGSETHFKVVVVSPAFSGKGRIERHRSVTGLLADELAGGLHALSIHAFTAEEWAKRAQGALASPACRGGGKGARNA
jgi:BolA protein